MRFLQEIFETRFGGLDDWEQVLIVAALERAAKLLDAETLDAAPRPRSRRTGPETSLSRKTGGETGRGSPLLLAPMHVECISYFRLFGGEVKENWISE